MTTLSSRHAPDSAHAESGCAVCASEGSRIETGAPRPAQVEPAPLPKLAYRVEEAAELISLGRTKVVALVSTGELPSIKVGGRRLIPRQDLQAFINRLREDAMGDAVS